MQNKFLEIIFYYRKTCSLVGLCNKAEIFRAKKKKNQRSKKIKYSNTGRVLEGNIASANCLGSADILLCPSLLKSRAGTLLILVTLRLVEMMEPCWCCALIMCINSQNHRITEWSGLEGTSVGHLVQPSWGSPRAGCTGPCPSGSGISPEKETPQPPWAAWARAPPPSEGRSSSSCSAGASSASVCARCPLSCHWAPLNRVWPHPPDTHP